MTSVNLYDILELDSSCTKKDIKKAYIKIVKQIHPDKKKGDNEMFEIVTHAYNVLINDDSRKEYDKFYEMSKYTESHTSLKNQSDDFFKMLDKKDNKSTVSKEKAKKEFTQAFENMDLKHGIRRDEELLRPLNEKETNRRLADMQDVMTQDDIENMHERIFEEGAPMDLSRFNAAFDSMYKKHSEMVPHDGNPFAFNSISGLSSNSFSYIDKYDELYDDDGDVLNSSIFGPVNINVNKKQKITKKDVDDIQGSGYTRDHNKVDKDYAKSLDELIAERDNQTKTLKDISQGNFNTDSNCGGYGFLHEVGIDDIKQLGNDDYGEDLKEKYKKLLDNRNKKD